MTGLFRIPLRSFKSGRKGQAMTFPSRKALLRALTIKGNKAIILSHDGLKSLFVSKSLPEFLFYIELIF